MQPAPLGGAGVLLRCTGSRKRFGAVQALRDVDFSIAAGRVRGLVGENGAGKSTLAKIIAGVIAPDAGSMEFEGRPIRSASADEALAQRIVTVHQDINLIPSMTVIENLLLNNEPASRLGIIRRRDARETAEALLDRYEIAADPEALVEELSNDLRKMIQIVKAIHRDPKVLILDEPTSSLTSAQVSVVLRLIRQLASQGVGLVLISHYLSEIFEVCDDLTIMRDGEVVVDRLVRDMTLPQVVAAMVGREVKAGSRASRGREPARDAAPRLSVENLTVARRAGRMRASLSARARSSGVTGLAGSGLERALARHLRRLGAPGDRPGHGRCDRRCAPVEPFRLASRGNRAHYQRPPARGRAARLPADREHLPADPVALRRRARRPEPRDMERTTLRNIERLRIRTPGPLRAAPASFPAATSRKLLFAKWLETGRRSS